MKQKEQNRLMWVVLIVAMAFIVLVVWQRSAIAEEVTPTETPAVVDTEILSLKLQLIEMEFAKNDAQLRLIQQVRVEQARVEQEIQARQAVLKDEHVKLSAQIKAIGDKK